MIPPVSLLLRMRLTAGRLVEEAAVTVTMSSVFGLTLTTSAWEAARGHIQGYGERSNTHTTEPTLACDTARLAISISSFISITISLSFSNMLALRA